MSIKPSAEVEQQAEFYNKLLEQKNEQIARLQTAITDALSHLEHFAHANAQYNPDALSAHSILTEALAIDSTPQPATPASTEAAAGERYEAQAKYGDWCVVDTKTGKVVTLSKAIWYRTPEAAENEAARLNATQAGHAAAEGGEAGSGEAS